MRVKSHVGGKVNLLFNLTNKLQSPKGSTENVIKQVVCQIHGGAGTLDSKYDLL